MRQDPRWWARTGTTHYGADVGRHAAALATELTPGQVAALDALLRALEEYADARRDAEDERYWRGLVAHFPGLAPALEMVWQHVHGQGELVPQCQTPDGAWQTDCPLTPRLLP